MMRTRALIVIGSVAISLAAGCANPLVSTPPPMLRSSAAGAAGSGSGTVSTAGAQSVTGAASTDAAAPLPKCPTGFQCTDLSIIGAVALDGEGKPIAYSCGNGQLIDCNDANPKASCAALTDPICAHVKVGGMDLVSCGQRCAP
jgi:hypothetical protein